MSNAELTIMCVNLIKIIRQFSFRLESIFATTQAVSKYDAQFKNEQKWLKNNHLASLN